jgi:hypothetical protein
MTKQTKTEKPFVTVPVDLPESLANEIMVIAAKEYKGKTLAEVVVEWLTPALYCHYMERDDLVPHEDLLAAAVTGVFVAELNVEDGEEDDGEDDEKNLTHLKSKKTKTTISTSNTYAK